MFQEAVGSDHIIEVQYDHDVFVLAMCGIEVIVRNYMTTNSTERLNAKQIAINMLTHSIPGSIGPAMANVQESADYGMFIRLFRHVFPDEELPPPQMSPVVQPLFTDMSAEHLAAWRRALPQRFEDVHLPRVLKMRRPCPSRSRRSSSKTPPAANRTFRPQDYRYPTVQLIVVDGPVAEEQEHHDLARRIETRQNVLEIMRLLQPVTEWSERSDDDDPDTDNSLYDE